MVVVIGFLLYVYGSVKILVGDLISNYRILLKDFVKLVVRLGIVIFV